MTPGGGGICVVIHSVISSSGHHVSGAFIMPNHCQFVFTLY
jgi:hypothetical protein